MATTVANQAGAGAGLRAVDTGPGCNNRCSICSRPSPAADSPDAFTAPEVIDAIDLGGTGPLVIHGGEPTLHPGFEALVSRAREAGRTVVVETNGRAFSAAAANVAVRAAKAGVRHAVITLHGAKEPSHDYLTRTPGSFRQAVAGATRLRAAGVPITVRVLVTRSALPELSQIATTALGLGAAAVRFSWARNLPSAMEKPIGKRDFPTHFPAPSPREWLIPRLSLGIDPVAAAARAVARVGRPVALDGVPLCLAPAGLAVVPASPTCMGPPDDAYAPPCDGCAKRSACPGVPQSYLDRFGHSELVPFAP